jgi:hypothetical protein
VETSVELWAGFLQTAEARTAFDVGCHAKNGMPYRPRGPMKFRRGGFFENDSGFIPTFLRMLE